MASAVPGVVMPLRRPMQNSRPGAAAVLKAFGGQLAKFKMPKRVFVVVELPHNAMGKVQKNFFRDTCSKIYAKTK